MCHVITEGNQVSKLLNVDVSHKKKKFMSDEELSDKQQLSWGLFSNQQPLKRRARPFTTDSFQMFSPS